MHSLLPTLLNKFNVRAFPQNLDAFYPYYLCEHTKPATKLFHFTATLNALALVGRTVSGGGYTNLGLALLRVIRDQ